MVVDYSERRQAAKSRPRRQPIGLYLFIMVGTIGSAYGLGFFTAWYLYRPAAQLRKAPPPAVPPKKVAAEVAPQPASAPVPPPAAPVNKAADVPLTFYETLSKGNKSLIGTGLNPKKDGGPVPGKAGASNGNPAPVPPVAKGDKGTTEPKPAEHDKTSPVAKEPSGDGAKETQSTPRFSVQVASYKEKKEADDLREKLTGKGLPASSVESKVEGKGTWYRVRVGRHLNRQDADALAARMGKGAMVIPE